MLIAECCHNCVFDHKLERGAASSSWSHQQHAGRRKESVGGKVYLLYVHDIYMYVHMYK